VSDDGRGIDRKKISSAPSGRRRGRARALTDDQLLRVLARPGFSTGRRVTSVSGRGWASTCVSAIRALGGHDRNPAEEGKGTTFSSAAARWRSCAR